MNKKQAAYLKAKFEEIVNNHVTVRYETGEVVNEFDSSVVDYFIIKPKSLIWDDEWMMMESFANLMHMCIRYHVNDKHWLLY